MPSATLNRAAIYVKANAGNSPDSAEADTQMAEADTQMAEAEEYCRSRGLEVAARYSDSRICRESFQQMMADAESDEAPFDHVVVWRLRHFAWSLEESVLAPEKLRANGVRLLSVNERIPDRYPSYDLDDHPHSPSV